MQYTIESIKSNINKARTALVGSGFFDYDYWSSREFSSYYEYYVPLGNGGVNTHGGKNENRNVLAFLALEV